MLDGLREVLLALSEFEFWTPPQKRDLLAKFFPRIEISKRGVERVLVKLPHVRLVDGREVASDNDLPITATVGLTWNELTPPPEINELGLVSKAFYKRADIKQVLGLTEAQFVGRLESGEIPAPGRRGRGHRTWTEQQVREMVRSAEAAKQIGEFGLLRKALYSTGDLCNVQGLSWDRVRRMIQRGQLPESSRRDANGHRVSTAEEMRAAVDAHGAPKADNSQATGGAN